MSSQAEQMAWKRSWIERVHAASLNDSKRVTNATLPSFFVIGPPRTGTTWLYDILRAHTLLPAPTKETRFFDAHFHRGLGWYRAHFPASTAGLRVGEIAPTYFASSDARTRIASLLPHAKVVCIFRNPVERVMSLYKLKSAYGLVPWTFELAMVRDPEMLESSRYATKLEAWQSVLGRNQVLAMIYDDLRDKPQSFLDAVVDFIGAPRFKLTESERRCIHASENMTHPRSYHRTRSVSTVADWCKARRLDRLVAAVRDSPLRKLFLGGGPPFEELPEEILRELYQLFRPEVEELESMLNRDLTPWKTMGARV